MEGADSLGVQLYVLKWVVKLQNRYLSREMAKWVLSDWWYDQNVFINGEISLEVSGEIAK
jgi:hypothetical protein